MSTPLTIVAIIEAKPDQRERLKEALIKLIEPTLAEAGCLQYDLHEDHENPNVFLFFENWENRELWQAHMKSPHILAHIEATEDAVANVVLHEMGKVGA